MYQNDSSVLFFETFVLTTVSDCLGDLGVSFLPDFKQFEIKSYCCDYPDY